MATGVPSPRRKPRENQYLFDVGVRGRKTGLTVPDSGIRDEYGLEPMDDLFSSPAKVPKSSKAGRRSSAKTANATISSEEDMELGESAYFNPAGRSSGCTIPEPTAVLTERKRSSMRMPPPRSKSPIKTFLQSPARRNPSLGPISSPTRGSIISPSRAQIHTSVNRRLDFSVDDLDRNHRKAPIRSSPLKRIALQKNSFTEKLMNGIRISPVAKLTSAKKYQEQDQFESLQPDYDLDLGNDDDPYHLIGGDYGLDEQYQDEHYTVPASSPELDAESPLQATKKRRGTTLVYEPAAKKSKGKSQNGVGPSHGKASSSRAVEASKAPIRNLDVKPTKGTRGPSKVSKSSSREATKKVGPRKAEMRDSSPSRVSSSPIVHRGPPRPKHNRGLYILRRETPDDGAQTRSGRHVIKPVAYWKNETVVYGDDEEADGDASFLLPTVKEVIRADNIEQPKTKRAPKKAAGAGRSRKPRPESESEEDEDLTEPWESEPGRVYGALRMWDPADPIGEESGEKEEEIALSSAAIITREIAGASFRFAKTLTLPFFGSGMVDLPPGAVKKPKNSRRMQMVFFVFSGRVSVTVNENAFRIGKGGMWQVPRGNFYSIENDYDKPARIFFSQGCEVIESTEAY